MTAATTTENKKKSFFSVRLKSKFSEDIKLFITTLVFQLLGFPLIAGVILRASYIEEKNKLMDIVSTRALDKLIPFVFIGIIAVILGVAMGLFIPMFNFRYLYNKSLVDMNMSLPLNSRQRFFADYLSGLAAYILPFILGTAIAFIELLIGSAFIDLGKFMDTIPVLFKIEFAALVGMIMLYSICVFAISFAGSMFEAIFGIVSVNIVIPLFVFITWANIVAAAHFGLDSESVIKNFTFFTTSPAGVLGYILSSVEGWTYSVYEPDFSEYGRYYSLAETTFTGFMIRSLLFISIVTAVTFLLYKHRKAESVGKPYVYKAFYYIIMTVAVYCIVSAMNFSEIDNSIVPALIISGILWFIMEVIRRRGFKRFWTAVLSFAAASAAVICVVKAIDVTHGLGRAKYIPSASSVADVEIEISGNSGIMGYSDYPMRKQVFSDPVIINDAIEINREIVDRHFKPDNFDYEMSEYVITNDGSVNVKLGKSYYFDEQNVRIVYHKKGGSAIVRNYTVPTEMLTDICCDIYTNKEFAEQKTKGIYYSNLRYINKYSNSTPCSENEAEFFELDVCDKLGKTLTERLSPEEGRQLCDALCSDYTAMTADEFRNSDYICGIDGLIVNTSCENTIRFLEGHDIPYNKTSWQLVYEMDHYSDTLFIVPDPEYVFPMTLIKESNSEDDFYLNDVFRNGLSKECIKLDSILSLGIYRDRSSVNYKEKHFEFKDREAVEKLLDAATPVVTGEKVIAEVKYSDVILYVKDSADNRSLIEKAMDSVKYYDNKTGELFEENITY